MLGIPRRVASGSSANSGGNGDFVGGGFWGDGGVEISVGALTLSIVFGLEGAVTAGSDFDAGTAVLALAGGA